MIQPIDPSTAALVGMALDAANLRQLAHSSNLASANVPGYKPVAVRFEDQLQAVRDAIAQGSLSPSTLSAAGGAEMVVGAEAGVQVDQEVAAMSRNALHYQALVKLLNTHYGLVGAAIDGGKR